MRGLIQLGLEKANVKQLFAIGLGIVLLALLIVPKLSSQNASRPMAIRLVRYESRSGVADSEAILEAKNNTPHLIYFGLSQPEYLAPPQRWEMSSLETNYPVVKLKPRDKILIRIVVPSEGRTAVWRVPFYCSMASSRLQRRVNRLFAFLKIREKPPPSAPGLLYSGEFPPTH